MIIGKSIVALPDSFVVVDIETTGLDYEFDDIIELSVVRYEKGVRVGAYESLCKPPLRLQLDDQDDDINVEKYVSEFITELTGITDEMLETAPSISTVIPEFLDFIGKSVIIGHNIAFDIRFIAAACDALGIGDFPNDYINTIRLARKVFPGNAHYRLSDVAEFCGVKQTSAHRALEDCSTTAECYLYMRKTILSEMTEVFQKKFERHSNSDSYEDFIKRLDVATDSVNEDNPIFQKRVVFTGTLERMPRKDALSIVARLGGIPSDKLNSETNYLVIGNGEFVSSVKNGKTNKMKKAESMALKGMDIHVISENVFFKMIDL